MIHAIWAEDTNHLIGSNNTLPWHIPSELQHFKKTTQNQILVMGSTTYEGMNKRLLPNRTSIIMSRNENYDVAGGILITNIKDCIKWYEQQDKDLFVIGGAQIITLFEPHIEIIHQTVIQEVFEGDTYFPKSFNWDPFELIKQERYGITENNKHEYIIKTFKRQKVNTYDNINPI